MAFKKDLEEGIRSLNRVYEALIKTEIEPGTSKWSNHDDIREEIKQAHKHLQNSEEMASSESQRLDETLTVLNRDKRKHESEINVQEKTIEDLRNWQRSKETELRGAGQALEKTRQDQNSIKQELQTEKENKDYGEKIRDIGAGLLVLPFAGWISGGIMVADGKAKMNQAADAIRAAEEKMKRSEIESERLLSKIDQYKDNISQTKNTITDKEGSLKKMKEEIEEVKKQIKSVDELQSKVKNAIPVLGDLRESASRAEHEICRFTLQEPLTKMMEYVMKATEQITGNELLYVHDMPGLIKQIKEKSQRLKDTNYV